MINHEWTGYRPMPAASTPYQKFLFGLMSSFDNGALNPYSAIQLEGPLDLARLQQAIQKVIQDNDALRTFWQVTDNDITMYLYESVDYTLNVLECPSLSAVQADIATTLKHNFYVSNDLSFRINLYQLSETTHVLLVLLSHAVSDGDSVALLVKKLISCYQDPHFSDRETTHSLAAYNQAEFAFLDTPAFAENLDYWKKHLVFDDYLTYTESVFCKEPATLAQLPPYFILEAEVMKACAKKFKCTFNNIIMAVYHITLCKMLKKDTSKFFFMYANRNDPKYTDLIAPQFQATFSVANLAKGQTLRETVRNIFMQSLDCIRHAHGCLLSFDLMDTLRSGIFAGIMTYSKLFQPFTMGDLHLSNFDVLFNSMDDTTLPSNLLFLACNETQHGILLCPLIATNDGVDRKSFLFDFQHIFTETVDKLYRYSPDDYIELY